MLHNVLDEGFESDLPDAVEPSDHFLAVGSAHGYRRLPALVRGFESYRRQGGCAELLVVSSPGTPSVDSELDALAATVPGVRHRSGGTSRAEVLALMSGSCGVILPSAVEASPITLLEALALGRPVACSRIPAHDEMLAGAEAARFSPDEPGSVASALHDLDERRGIQPSPLQDPVFRRAQRDEWTNRLTEFLDGIA